MAVKPVLTERRKLLTLIGILKSSEGWDFPGFPCQNKNFHIS